MTRIARSCVLDTVMPTPWCWAPPWLGTFVVLDHLLAWMSRDCSVASTPNRLAFVDACLSLPHATRRDHCYILAQSLYSKEVCHQRPVFLKCIEML